MAFSIAEWNLEPNRHWYVRLSDGSTGIKVELYKTKSDAQGQSNLVASGTSDGFGAGKEVSLEMATGGSPTIELFNTALGYHVRVSGSSGDPTKIFHVKPFVDLPDISHSIYRSSDLIRRRAILEINKGTHYSLVRTMEIPHNPALDEGTVIKITSSRRNLDVLATVTEYRIVGTLNTLIDSIEAVQYDDLLR